MPVVEDADLRLRRELGLADQPTVQAAVGNLKQNKYALRAMVQFIVQSEPFTRKVVEALMFHIRRPALSRRLPAPRAGAAVALAVS